MASQYALNEARAVERDLALTELAARLQPLESEVAQPTNPCPRYAVWVYSRARGRNAVAPAVLGQHSSFA